jgi:uncharacterized HhH-GPD family protein
MSARKAKALHFTGDPEADRLLATDPLALLIGYVLDQQIPLQKAFSGPLELQRRLGALDAKAIADMETDALEAVFREKPALHRFPASMARRTQDLCRVLVDDHGSDASRIWSEAVDGDDLKRRLQSLPGFGAMKVASLAAVLGKRLGVQPPGWEKVAPAHFCLGDVDSPARLAEYQAAKRAHKATLRVRSGS